MSLEEHYQTLLSRLQRLDTLSSVNQLLFWDEQVNLPEGSAALRAEQLAEMEALYHREASQPELGELLSSLEAHPADLNDEQKAVVKEARRDYDHLTKLPSEFVTRKTKAHSAGFHAWKKARAEDDFSAYAPFLKTNLELAQEEAAYLGHTENAYDFWIDQFDPGMSQAVIDPLFAALEADLKPLVESILAASAQQTFADLKGFPIEAQESFLTEVVKAFGFNHTQGRIDIAVHPFCGGHPRDTRMTTRYDADNPLDSLSSAMHECGHALYEQGLPPEFPGTALSKAAGMAAHESQSRLWENQVGRSRAFWQRWEAPYRKTFPQLESVDSETLYRTINRVAITPIRVDADEVTYNLHILLRYRMERDLFSGAIAVQDVPDAWNAHSERILGHLPKSDKEGCLQDVHWSEGLFGYFPSYTLGNLLAAQLWERILVDLPEIESQFADGDYKPLLEWLQTHVHALGKRKDTRSLCLHVTGKELSHRPLIQYLEGRYGTLYSH